MFTVLSSWHSHCESSPGSFDECRTAPSGRQVPTQDQARRLRLYRLPESTLTITIYYYHSARKLILILPSHRLSRASSLVTYRDGLPVYRRSPIWY